MNPKNKIVSIVAITTLLLAGCANTKQDNTQHIYHRLSGRVADGYIAGAKVCLDTKLYKSQNKVLIRITIKL